MVYKNTMQYSLSANILSLTLCIYNPLEQLILTNWLYTCVLLRAYVMTLGQA